MSSSLLVKYIRMILESEMNPRVPAQLVNTKKSGKSEKENENEEDVNEFSGVGNIVGYIGTMAPDSPKKRAERSRFK